MYFVKNTAGKLFLVKTSSTQLSKVAYRAVGRNNGCSDGLFDNFKHFLFHTFACYSSIFALAMLRTILRNCGSSIKGPDPWRL